MICASCGKQIPTGARYCVHCGAEQSPATPIAAVAAAASMASASRARAANAAHAEPGIPPSFDAANQASAKTGGRDRVHRRDSGARPAYAAAPTRRGLAAGFIGGCLLVAVAVVIVVGWRMQDSGTNSRAGQVGDDRAATTQGAAGVPASEAAAAAVPGRMAEQAPPSVPVTGTREPAEREAAVPAPTGAAAGTVVTDPARQPVEIKPLPPRPAPSRAARRAPVEKESPLPESGTPAPPPEAPPAQRERALATTSGRMPSVSTVADRWRDMDNELSRCTRADFITRVVCGQRVRFRYCDGYWGKVGQCPANPVPERGQ